MKNILRFMIACLLACALSPPLVRAGGGMGENPYEIGRKLLAGKHYKTAIAYFQKALRRNDGRAHYGMGRVYEATGKDSDALGSYRQFIDLGPLDANSSDAVQRITAIEERLEKKTTRTTELLDWGKSLFKNRKYREAEKALLKAAAEDESTPEVHFYLGEVYMKLEQYGKAKSEYEKAKGYY